MFASNLNALLHNPSFNSSSAARWIPAPRGGPSVTRKLRFDYLDEHSISGFI